MIPERLQSRHFNQLLLGITGVFSVVVFIVDIFIPLGASGSMVYVLFVMATYWKEKNYTLSAGAAGTIFTIGGLLFSATSEYLIFSAINHFLAIVVIWATVWFVNNYKVSLNQVRQDYRGLFRAATDEILVCYLDKNNQPTPFIEVNDTACEILGYSREELLQKSIYDISTSEKKEINRQIKNVLEQEEIIGESYQMTKDGSIIPLELSVRLFPYNGRQAIISVGRDLRERRRLEQEILNVSEQERQRIGRDLHDDIGQLLSVATLTARMLERDMEARGMQEVHKVRELTDMIKKAGEHSRTLSHGLVPFNVEQNGLHEALQELTDNVSSMYNINIHYSGKQDTRLAGSFKTVHIYRIVQEAINNAVKHGNATSINVEFKFSENHCAFCVEDNGSGFIQSEVTEGIGMRIMKFRANMIGGDINISSKKGKGTKVFCRMKMGP